MSDLMTHVPATPGPSGLPTSSSLAAYLMKLFNYLENGDLPSDDKESQRLVVEAGQFIVLDGVLNYPDPKQENRQRIAVPSHLQTATVEDDHKGAFSGHFSGKRVYNVLVRSWWWPKMYAEEARLQQRIYKQPKSSTGPIMTNTRRSTLQSWLLETGYLSVFLKRRVVLRETSLDKVNFFMLNVMN